LYPPVLWAKQVDANKRDVPVNEMGFEIYPKGIYEIVKQFSKYQGIDNIIITENGVCIKDELIEGKIIDKERIEFFENYLYYLLKAKNEGAPVNGYCIWSLTDNFEWSEGYEPKFGVVHIDFKSQKRTIKSSGYWFQEMLAE